MPSSRANESILTHSTAPPSGPGTPIELAAATAALEALYAEHAAAQQPLIAQAVCLPGCAFCCTHYGRVDTLTLEGLRIRQWVLQQPALKQRQWRQRIERNSRERLAGRAPVCPFLSADKRCRIYAVRPFSCRQLYSLRSCDGSGPLVHRAAAELARQTVAKLQQLDGHGYCGHLSDVLCLLADETFARFYRAGGFNPAAIATFGKRCGLIVNRNRPAGQTSAT